MLSETRTESSARYAYLALIDTTARYPHLARDPNQNAVARITGSIGGDLMTETNADQAGRYCLWSPKAAEPRLHLTYKVPAPQYPVT